MPNGRLFVVGVGKIVITPAGVMRPTAAGLDWVNQTLSSGPTVIQKMLKLPAGRVKTSPGPTTPVVLIRAIVFPAAYQILLSGPTSTPVSHRRRDGCRRRAVPDAVAGRRRAVGPRRTPPSDAYLRRAPGARADNHRRLDHLRPRRGMDARGTVSLLRHLLGNVRAGPDRSDPADGADGTRPTGQRAARAGPQLGFRSRLRARRRPHRHRRPGRSDPPATTHPSSAAPKRLPAITPPEAPRHAGIG